MAETESNINDTVARIVGLIARRKWWILGATFVTSLTVVAGVRQIPDRYSAEATLVVVQQQVSQLYVPATTTASIADAVNSMTREILSRARLLAIIDEFGLYAKDRNRLTPEALVDRMRLDVVVDPLEKVPNFSAFKVSFTAESAALAQQVTTRLTSLFIDENDKARGNQVATTAGFLSEQVEAANRNLAQQEQRLRDFKMNNIGDLPEQQGANVGILTDLRMQLTNTTAGLGRARQQRVYLESTIAANLARLQSDRAALLNQFTSKHPSVTKKDQSIASIETLLARLKGGGPIPENGAAALALDDPSLAQLTTQVEANAAEIAQLSKDEQSLTKEIREYQNRVRLTPVREQQLSTILRDYELFKREYTDLMSKQLQFRLTANLEKRQEGQHFRLVDPPTLPRKPASPKRLKLTLGGTAAGVFLGFALAFLMESKDSSFHTEEEAIECLKLPLVALPLLLTPAEERGRNVRTLYEWGAASVMVLTLLAVQYYVFIHG